MENLCGFNNPFETGNVVIIKTTSLRIRDFNAIFHFKLKKLKINEHEYQRTFILEIEYEKSYEEHCRNLPLNGFGSYLCFDYADKVNELAEKFCKEQNLKMHTHINSWPTFWMVVAYE